MSINDCQKRLDRIHEALDEVQEAVSRLEAYATVFGIGLESVGVQTNGWGVAIIERNNGKCRLLLADGDDRKFFAACNREQKIALGEVLPSLFVQLECLLAHYSDDRAPKAGVACRNILRDVPVVATETG